MRPAFVVSRPSDTGRRHREVSHRVGCRLQRPRLCKLSDAAGPVPTNSPIGRVDGDSDPNLALDRQGGPQPLAFAPPLRSPAAFLCGQTPQTSGASLITPMEPSTGNPCPTIDTSCPKY